MLGRLVDAMLGIALVGICVFVIVQILVPQLPRDQAAVVGVAVSGITVGVAKFFVVVLAKR